MEIRNKKIHMTYYVCLSKGKPIFETVAEKREDCVGKYLKLKAWEFRESERIYNLMLEQAASNLMSGEILTAKMEIKLSEICVYGDTSNRRK